VLHERPILNAASPKVMDFHTNLRQFLHFDKVWLSQ
jgi:hypothetical protein